MRVKKALSFEIFDWKFHTIKAFVQDNVKPCTTKFQSLTFASELESFVSRQEGITSKFQSPSFALKPESFHLLQSLFHFRVVPHQYFKFPESNFCSKARVSLGRWVYNTQNFQTMGPHFTQNCQSSTFAPEPVLFPGAHITSDF